MRLGSDADSVTATNVAFSDCADHPLVRRLHRYCVSEGIIAGMGDGTFAPTANVTGYQFAKLLLTALGYDADIEGYTGSQWAVNVPRPLWTSSCSTATTAPTTTRPAPVRRPLCTS